MRLRVGHQHSQFWPILAHFLDYYSPFWGPEAISIVVEPQGAVYVSVTNTGSFGRFWPVSWTITHYFVGLEQISIVVEPQGALTCRSSTLAVLADSGPFRDLLLTVLGYQGDFHD